MWVEIWTEDLFLSRADVQRPGDRLRLRTDVDPTRPAGGSKPRPPDGPTLVAVGDRHLVHGDFGTAAAETIAEAVNAFTRPTAPRSTATPGSPSTGPPDARATPVYPAGIRGRCP